MSWECIIPGNEIEDVKVDKKGAKRVEQYIVSDNALYFEGKYLPLNLIESVSIHDGVYKLHCCCGSGGLPVKELKIKYGTDKPLILMVEKDKNAQKLADMLMSTQRTEDEE